MNTKVEEYNRIIRQMIKNEDDVRNQRTNWFLIIQGFSVAALCHLTEDCNKLLIIMITLIGMITSLSFLYVAWRSTKAINMALACWQLVLEEHSEMEGKYPPVSLITKDIISTKIFADSGKADIHDRNKAIFSKMYAKRSCWVCCRDKMINSFEFLLPYRFLPIVFLLFWLLILLFDCSTDFTCLCVINKFK